MLVEKYINKSSMDIIINIIDFMKNTFNNIISDQFKSSYISNNNNNYNRIKNII